MSKYSVYNGASFIDSMKTDISYYTGSAFQKIKEGDFYWNGTTWIPILREGTPTLGLRMSGGNMIFTWSYNDTIKSVPTVVIMGSSTAVSHGLSGSDTLQYKLQEHFNTHWGGANIINIGLGGLSSEAFLPTGEPGSQGPNNCDTALTYSPDLVLMFAPSNDVSSGNSNAQWLANVKTVRTKLEQNGAKFFFLGPGARDQYNLTQQTQLRDAALLFIADLATDYCRFDTYPTDLWLKDDPSNPAKTNPTYYQSDKIHLAASGMTYLVDNVVVPNLEKQLRPNTAYQQFEVERSSDGSSGWTNFDTITDQQLIKKSYTKTAGFYRVRALLKDGSYTPYSNVVQITNSSPTADAGDDLSLPSGTTSVSITGSGSDTDGTIVSYLWEVVSGTGLTLVNANTATVTVNGMVDGGAYTLRLTVTDDSSATGSDTVNIQVASDYEPFVDHRLLLDLGGDGLTTHDGGSIKGWLTASPDGMSPSKYWNNLIGNPPPLSASYPTRALGWTTGFTQSNLVDTNNVDRNITFTLLRNLYNGYESADATKGINFAGATTDIGDYPVTAVQDSIFNHNPSGNVPAEDSEGMIQFSGLSALSTYRFKFWGARGATTNSKMQIKVDGTDWSTAQLLDGKNASNNGPNTNYDQAAFITVSGVSEVIFRIRSPQGQQFGHLGVIDILVTRPQTTSITGGPDDNVYDSATGQKTWITLPKDYDPSLPGGYPLHMFFHGAGEVGNDPSVMETATLVKQLLAGQRAQCITLCPQLGSGEWTAAIAKKAYDYAIANFPINTNKVYASALSAGAKAVVEFASTYPALLTAYAVGSSFAAGMDSTKAEAMKNIPCWWSHSLNEDTNPASGQTFPVLNLLYATSPRGRFAPESSTLYEPGHDNNSWNENIFDNNLAKRNLETDFFLLYDKDVDVSCTNLVDRAETSMIWYDFAKACLEVSKMSSGSTKTSLQSRLAAVHTAMTTTLSRRLIALNLGGTSSYDGGYAYNNCPTSTNGTVYSALKDTNNNTTGVGFEVTTNYQPGSAVPGIDADILGLPSDIASTNFQVDSTVINLWKFTGLDNAKYYDLILYPTDKSTEQANTNHQWGIKVKANDENGQSRICESWNSFEPMIIRDIRPSSGEIQIRVDPIQYFQTNGFNVAMYKGAICFMVLRERATTCIANSFKVNFSVGNLTVASWSTLTGDPTTAVRTATDAVNGYQINTVSTADARWTKYSGLHGSDTEYDDGTETGALPHPPQFPDLVARGAMFNYGTGFDKAVQNYNLQITNNTGGGLPAGKYRLRMYGATKYNAWTNAGNRFIVRSSNGFQYQDNTPYTTPTYYFITFELDVAEGSKIDIGFYNSRGGLSQITFLSGLILDKIND